VYFSSVRETQFVKLIKKIALWAIILMNLLDRRDRRQAWKGEAKALFVDRQMSQ
jgi:hypothetical protein